MKLENMSDFVQGILYTKNCLIMEYSHSLLVKLASGSVKKISVSYDINVVGFISLTENLALMENRFFVYLSLKIKNTLITPILQRYNFLTIKKGSAINTTFKIRQLLDHKLNQLIILSSSPIKINRVDRVHLGRLLTLWQLLKYFADNYDKIIKKVLLLWVNFSYSGKVLAKSSNRLSTLNLHKATVGAKISVFFYVVNNAYLYSMVALLGQSSDWLVSLCASSANPDNVTANKDISTSGGDPLAQHKEIASMANVPNLTYPKQTQFFDSYWFTSKGMVRLKTLVNEIELFADKEKKLVRCGVLVVCQSNRQIVNKMIWGGIEK